MQKLHLVGFTTDHKSLILSARRGARSGGFVLEVDEAIAAAVADAAALVDAEDEAVTEDVPAAPPRPQSNLSVKDIQARLRSGRSIESVAAEAGVDAEWVTRFAMPVLTEQARVIDTTRTAIYSRARLGPSSLPLGQAVYRNLAAKGVRATVDELDGGWTTRQTTDGRWLVTLAYTSRGKRQTAVWEMDLRRHEVKAVDRLAGELAWVAGAVPAAASVPAPSKPAKGPAGAPTDRDRANARKVAEARKHAAAQLAEAARVASKRSLEAARKASAAKPKKKPKPVVAPEPDADEVAEVADAVDAIRGAADALPPDAGDGGVPYRPGRVPHAPSGEAPTRPARGAGDDESTAEASAADGADGDETAPVRPVRAGAARPRSVGDGEAAARTRPGRPARADEAAPVRAGAARSRSAGDGEAAARASSADGDEAAPVRPVRAGATRSRSAGDGDAAPPPRPAGRGGRLRADRTPTPTPTPPAPAPAPAGPVRLVAAEDDDALPSEATQELPVARLAGDDLTPSQPPPPPPRPSRSLQRAVAADDLRGPSANEPKRVPLRFRDDLASPAAPTPRNGAQPNEPAASNGDAPQARRRRGAPLRAR